MLGSSLAQVPPVPTTVFIPSPAGVVISVGKWIYDQITAETVYYIEVVGQGRTPEEARLNGFRVAVEQAIGSVVSSESEGQNSRLIKDEIINYSAGYVDRYEIVKTEASSYGQKIQMKVWIRRSSLPNRLLARSKAEASVDGNLASIRLETLNYERQQGDRLVDTVLADFPKRAFSVGVKNTELKYNNRQGVLEIPFKLTWDQNYINSLQSALVSTAQSGSNSVAQIRIASSALNFDDRVKFNKIINRMIATRPAIQITITDTENRRIYQNCFRWSELDHVDGYRVRAGHFVEVNSMNPILTINSPFKLDGIAQIPVNPAFLAQANRVDAEVVLGSACSN